MERTRVLAPKTIKNIRATLRRVLASAVEWEFIDKVLSLPKVNLLPVERIERAILVLPGHRVIWDRELATLYDVTTGNLNKAVSRNIERFPDDFMFQLSPDEVKNLIFHSGTSSWDAAFLQDWSQLPRRASFHRASLHPRRRLG